MAFNEKLPKWDNVGVEPPESKKTEGWQPTEKPPAQWFNWIFNRIYKVVEELQGKSVEKGIVGSLTDLTTTINTSIVNAINWLKGDLDAHKAESASLTKKGHVQLQTIASANETNALTPKALNDHLDNAQAHGATYIATPDRIILRDSAGRAKVVAPSASDDIARKKEVDDVQTNLNNHSETGVWTPSVKGESTPGTPTYSARLGRYVRNGKLVYCDFDIAFSLSGGAGNIALSGLPFIPKEYGIGGTIIFATKDGVSVDISTISNLATITDFRILDSKKGYIEKTTIGDSSIKLLGTLTYQIS